MGLGDTIGDNTPSEEDKAFVDANDRTRAHFRVDRSGKGKSFTSETEILRGSLAKILYDGTKEKAKYIFSHSVKSVDETDSGIPSHLRHLRHLHAQTRIRPPHQQATASARLLALSSSPMPKNPAYAR